MSTFSWIGTGNSDYAGTSHAILPMTGSTHHLRTTDDLPLPTRCPSPVPCRSTRLVRPSGLRWAGEGERPMAKRGLDRHKAGYLQKRGDRRDHATGSEIPILRAT
jgi:hypothetical protein